MLEPILTKEDNDHVTQLPHKTMNKGIIFKENDSIGGTKSKINTQFSIAPPMIALKDMILRGNNK